LSNHVFSSWAVTDIDAGAYVRKPYIKEKLGLAVKKELDRVA
jgi:hypothetical protein